MISRLLLALMLLTLTACQRVRPLADTAEVAPMSTQEPCPLPGVTPEVLRVAASLASSALVPTDQRAQSALDAAAALDMVRLADSLVGGQLLLERGPVDAAASRNAALAISSGAEAFEMSAQEEDSLRALALLEDAAARFEAALDANPFDEDAHLWLAHTLVLQGNTFGQLHAFNRAIEVLHELVALAGHRADYVGFLAETYEQVDSVGAALAAGALWLRAAQTTADDAALAPQEGHAPDSAAIFAQLTRSSRAFLDAMRSDLALSALDSAAQWASDRNQVTFLAQERRWILWDGGNLRTRIRFDSLLTIANEAPEAALAGLRALVPRIRSPYARLQTAHEAALLMYRTERWEEAVTALQVLWTHAQDLPADSSLTARVREDYGTITFNVGMARWQEGEHHAALAYLMQSEATGTAQSARAALQVSYLLVNDVDAALSAAHRAEEGWDQLPRPDRQRLMRLMVELYRRSGDRERAAAYVAKYRSMR